LINGSVLALVLLLGARDASAGAWTRDAGSFYGQLGFSFISAGSFYGPDSKSQALGSKYGQQTLSLYGEVGIIDRWLTASIDATLFRRAALADQGHTSGMGDLRLGLWTGLLTSPIRLSAGVLVGVPSGDPRPEAGDADAQLIANSLPTGDGEIDAELAVAAGYGFGGNVWPLRHFLQAQVGYWLRTKPREVAFGVAKDFPDSFNWALEIGTSWPGIPVVERLLLVVKLYGTTPFGDASTAEFSGLGGGVSHTSFALALHGRLWRGLGLSVTMAGAFAARNLPAGAQYTFALSYQR